MKILDLPTKPNYQFGSWCAAAAHPKWHQNMAEELVALDKNSNKELSASSMGKKAKGSKQIYTIKTNPNGSFEHYKAVGC